ncbi:sulfotransferase family protein [Microbulbifer mangrovi]|uniref:sulfotransferase family protein n=1 Tax=Microbulbifer mangrovi TaxID=927787 RepID=UPI0009903ED4|nr:sulfotransferase [Microbulbifer mangrovi]
MIFITGFPRSGTSLLSTLVDRHSKVCVPPETRYFEEVYRGQSSESIEYLYSAISRNKRISDLELDLTQLQILSRVGGEQCVFSLFELLMNMYARKCEKSLVCEKSPVHANYISLLLEQYSESKFIYILRDPRDSIASLLEVPWSHNSILRHSREWSYRFKTVLHLLEKWPERILLIKYEDLVVDQQKVLADVMSFIGVEIEKEQFIPSARSGTHREWEDQWKGNVNKAVSTDSVGKWRNKLSPLQADVVNSILSKYLITYGYETYMPSPVYKLLAITKFLETSSYVRLRRAIKNAFS